MAGRQAVKGFKVALFIWWKGRVCRDGLEFFATP